DETITVFAAASLTNALDDVDTAFTKQSGIKVVVSYGASSALAKRIEQGAPMDVFASANLQWMDYCARKKATRVNLLGNKLVLIAAKDASDGGFGNLAPTSALLLRPGIEQETPHEPMRIINVGGELTLQAKLGDSWEHIYRVISYPRYDGEYEITNWY